MKPRFFGRIQALEAGVFADHWNIWFETKLIKRLPKAGMDLIFTVSILMGWWKRAKSVWFFVIQRLGLCLIQSIPWFSLPLQQKGKATFKAAAYIRDDAICYRLFGAIDGKRKSKLKVQTYLQGAHDELAKILPSEVLKNFLVLLNFGAYQSKIKVIQVVLLKYSLGAYRKKQEKIALIYLHQTLGSTFGC